MWKMLRLIKGSATHPHVPVRKDEYAGLREAAVSGDKRALRTLLIQIGPRLLQVVRRVLGSDHPDVEDVTQEALLTFVDKLPEFRGESSVLHYACRIATYTALNVKRRSYSRARLLFDSPDLLESLDSSPSEQVEQRDLAVAVRDLVDKLPDPLAEALVLHVALGYTTAEVAEVAGVPLETARSRLRLAKQHLKRRLGVNPILRELEEERA